MPTLLGLLALFGFYAVGAEYTDGWALQLGSTRFPTTYHLVYMAFWGAFGTFTAGAFAMAAGRWATEPRAAALRRLLEAAPDRTWLLGTGALALVIPALIRVLILQDVAVSDDENAYHFAAELLARGRLTIESPEQKIFFDQDFMINNGRYFSQYFLGWPALLAPGVYIGSTGFMNAVYSALTLPALFLTARRLAGAPWGRVATLLYLTAPMIQFVAATELSHTSCSMMLAWLLWCVLRARDEDAPVWVDAAIGFTFSAAFFIRPTSAIGVGGPLLVWWAWTTWRRRAWARAAACAAPSLVLAAAFLAINKVQTGSALTPSYQLELPYHASNGYRFCRHHPGKSVTLHNMSFTDPQLIAARNAIAGLRFNFALFGWPCSVLFAIIGATSRAPAVRALAAGVASFSLVHLFLADAGIDAAGPNHYFEPAVPVLLLTIVGAAGATRWLRELGDTQAAARAARWPAALLVGAVLAAALGYTPVRARSLYLRGLDQSAPARMAEALDLHQVVVFTPERYNRVCRSAAQNLWFLRRPVNHPALAPDILWVNHLSIEEDRAYMALHPDRAGYVMVYVDDCDLRFVPVGSIAADSIPPTPPVQ